MPRTNGPNLLIIEQNVWISPREIIFKFEEAILSRCACSYDKSLHIKASNKFSLAILNKIETSRLNIGGKCVSHLSKNVA